METQSSHKQLSGRSTAFAAGAAAEARVGRESTYAMVFTRLATDRCRTRRDAPVDRGRQAIPNASFPWRSLRVRSLPHVRLRHLSRSSCANQHSPDPALLTRSRPSLLIVEDEEDACRNLSDIFSDLGYRVDTASDGREPLERLHFDRYDLAVLDLMMPTMDGVEFYGDIKRQSPETAVGTCKIGHATTT